MWPKIELCLQHPKLTLGKALGLKFKSDLASSMVQDQYQALFGHLVLSKAALAHVHGSNSNQRQLHCQLHRSIWVTNVVQHSSWHCCGASPWFEINAKAWAWFKKYTGTDAWFENSSGSNIWFKINTVACVWFYVQIKMDVVAWFKINTGHVCGLRLTLGQAHFKISSGLVASSEINTGIGSQCAIGTKAQHCSKQSVIQAHFEILYSQYSTLGQVHGYTGVGAWFKLDVGKRCIAQD